jgi:hypothetical protein
VHICYVKSWRLLQPRILRLYKYKVSNNIRNSGVVPTTQNLVNNVRNSGVVPTTQNLVNNVRNSGVVPTTQNLRKVNTELVAEM